MVITEKLIKSSIARTLANEFEPDIVIQGEQQSQDFQLGTISIRRVTQLQRTKFRSNERHVRTNTYIYELRYFPISNTEPLLEIDNVIDRIGEAFTMLPIYNKAMDTVVGKNHIRNIEYNVTDGVLACLLTFDLDTIKLKDVQKVQELEIIESVKEGGH